MERIVCRTCVELLRQRSTSFCLSCGDFFQDYAEPHLCAPCLQKKPVFSVHRSCGQYRGRLKDFILLYKYQGYRILGKELARFMFQTLGQSEEIWWGVEAIVPVPLHSKRKRRRGFNQASVLAKELSKMGGKYPVSEVLEKTENRPPQTFVQAEERGKNVKGVFAVKKKGRVKGKVILLIDDVYTTGATLKECSATLLQEGAKEVRAITLARA